MTSNVAAYSTDGETWTSATLPSQNYWYSVCWGSDKFVTVGYEGVGAYSTDGMTWDQTSVYDHTLASICY